jgi:periplasmic protein TonB
VLKAQATALEIPVTIQGAKPVEGTERRELFTEETKTTLVFENGAVLNLKSRVSLGQCVFLRNDQSGKEILCKVLEWRQGGETGYVDLEFAICDTEFWRVNAERHPAAEQKPEAQKTIDSEGESPVATANMESRAPDGGEFPATFLETNTSAPACPAFIKAEALPESANRAESNDTKGTELQDALPQAKLESPALTARETERVVECAELTDSGETSGESASEEGIDSMLESETRAGRKFGAGKIPIVIGIAASVLIALVLGGARHAKGVSLIHSSDQSSPASGQSRQNALPVAAKLAQQPSSAAATGGPTTAGAVSTSASSARAEVQGHGNNTGITPPPAAQANQDATVAQETEVVTEQHPPATTEGLGTARESNSMADSTASIVPKVEATSSLPSSEPSTLEQAKLQKPDEMNTTVMIPAKIVSQSRPSIPPWAKGLDTDGVVQLDALIDEKGNVAQTKPISGPRALQRVAEQAVALWIFEPALSDGKPTATHMVLTVQFQR